MYPVKSASHQERQRYAPREKRERKKGVGREDERKGKTVKIVGHKWREKRSKTKEKNK